MGSTLNALAIRHHLGRKSWSAPVRFGPDGWRLSHVSGGGSVIVTCADHDGDEWVHASIAWRGRTPTYADLKLLHAAVFRGGFAYQVFVPPSEHVNIHEHALHLFGRLDGKPAIPDFTEGTGSI